MPVRIVDSASSRASELPLAPSPAPALCLHRGVPLAGCRPARPGSRVLRMSVAQ